MGAVTFQVLIAALAAYCYAVPEILAVALIRGVALWLLWSWFVSPGLHAPGLTFPMAAGLSLVAHYLTYQDVDCVQPPRSDTSFLLRQFGYHVVRPLVVVSVGYFITLFL